MSSDSSNTDSSSDDDSFTGYDAIFSKIKSERQKISDEYEAKLSKLLCESHRATLEYGIKIKALDISLQESLKAYDRQSKRDIPIKKSNHDQQTKEYRIKGLAYVNKDGFTLDHTTGKNNWDQIITKSNKITIHLRLGDTESYTFKSSKGFTLKKICKLINKSYLKYAEDYYDYDDYDDISRYVISAFKFAAPHDVYPCIST